MFVVMRALTCGQLFINLPIAVVIVAVADFLDGVLGITIGQAIRKTNPLADTLAPVVDHRTGSGGGVVHIPLGAATASVPEHAGRQDFASYRIGLGYAVESLGAWFVAIAGLTAEVAFRTIGQADLAGIAPVNSAICIGMARAAKRNESRGAHEDHIRAAGLPLCALPAIRALILTNHAALLPICCSDAIAGIAVVGLATLVPRFTLLGPQIPVRRLPILNDSLGHLGTADLEQIRNVRTDPQQIGASDCIEIIEGILVQVDGVDFTAAGCE